MLPLPFVLVFSLSLSFPLLSSLLLFFLSLSLSPLSLSLSLSLYSLSLLHLNTTQTWPAGPPAFTYLKLGVKWGCPVSLLFSFSLLVPFFSLSLSLSLSVYIYITLSHLNKTHSWPTEPPALVLSPLFSFYISFFFLLSLSSLSLSHKHNKFGQRYPQLLLT